MINFLSTYLDLISEIFELTFPQISLLHLVAHDDFIVLVGPKARRYRRTPLVSLRLLSLLLFLINQSSTTGAVTENY